MIKYVAVICALFITACSNMQSVVRDKNTGSPIPSAIVNINQYSATTDALGHYTLTGAFVPGNTVMVNAPGYNIYTQTVKAPTEIVDVELTPKK